MRRTVLLLASAALAVLATSGAALAQEEDATPPETVLADWAQGNEYANESVTRFTCTVYEDPETYGITFECKLDDGTFEACTSPKDYPGLSEGAHSFLVRAKDAAGNIDSTPEARNWEIDWTMPTFNWTERPGRSVSFDGLDWVTSDTTPTWAWTVSDKNLLEGDSRCILYDITDSPWKKVSDLQPCPSPFTLPHELANGRYAFQTYHYDKASNFTMDNLGVEVDTAAPKVSTDSVKPTGNRVSRSADVIAAFDDRVYDSKRFVNIYKKGSSSPLAVDRFTRGSKKIRIDPKNNLKPGTSYTVKVTTKVNDGANNLEAPYSWNFKTRG